MRYRNVEFDLPETNTKSVSVGGILKIGVTFWSNSAFYGEKLATRRQSSSRGTFPSSGLKEIIIIKYSNIYDGG
jgi:hypothetical protein